MHARRFVTSAAATLLCLAVGGGTAVAAQTGQSVTSDSPPGTSSSASTTFTVAGKKVPATKVTETFTVVPGGGEVGSTYPTVSEPGVITPQIFWGNSYALSDESVQYWYRGTALAAANVAYNKKTGKNDRLVKVCIWYTQDKRKSSTVCSEAKPKGRGWTTGSVANVAFNDTLKPTAPQTQFNIETTWLDPSISAP